MKTEEEIDLYILGKLSKEEEEGFERSISEDEQLKEVVDTRKKVVLSLRMSELAKVKDHLTILEANIRDQKAPKSRWFYRIAAFLILGIGVAYFIWPKPEVSDTDLFSKYMQPYPNYVVYIVRSEEGGGKEKEAYSYYEQGEYAKAVNLLQELQTDSASSETLFYLANARIMLGDYDNALADLRQVDGASVGLEQQTNWYLSLLLLRKGETEEAKSYFRRVADAKDYKSEEAVIILQALAI